LDIDGVTPAAWGLKLGGWTGKCFADAVSASRNRNVAPHPEVVFLDEDGRHIQTLL